MARQTVVNALPTQGIPGSRYDTIEPDAAESNFISLTETAGIAPGRLVVYGADGTLVLPRTQLTDVDAIQLALASPVAPTEYNSGTFDGVITDDALTVAAPITLTLNNHADWDATVATLVYVGSEGTEITESLSIPDTGNVTLTSAQSAIRIVSLTIPAQSGTNGIFEIGYAVSDELGIAQIAGILIRNPNQEITTIVAPGIPAAAAFHSRRWVVTDQLAVKNQRAYVRIHDAATPAYGVFRSDSDGGDAVKVPHSYFVHVASATLAVVSFAKPF